MPRTNESGMTRLASLSSEYQITSICKEFVEMVCNAVARGWEQRRLDEERLG